MKQFVLPETLGNAILQYLGRQPYLEVAGMINALQTLQEIDPKTLEVVTVPGKKAKE